MDSQTRIQTAQILSITSSMLISGYCLGFSQNSVSELYEEGPQVSTRIFKRIFHKGAYVGIPFSITSIASSAYLAFAVPEKRKLWLIAGALIISIRFLTDVVMMPSMKRLVAISEDEKLLARTEQTLEHRQLLVQWVNQNYLRVGVALASGLLGLWATTS